MNFLSFEDDEIVEEEGGGLESTYNEGAIRDRATGNLRPSLPFSETTGRLICDHGGVKHFFKSPVVHDTMTADASHDRTSLNIVIGNSRAFEENHQAVVRVFHKGVGIGTGFFVAPGIVCTSIHVSKLATEESKLFITSRIQARSLLHDGYKVGKDLFACRSLLSDWHPAELKEQSEKGLFDVDPSFKKASIGQRQVRQLDFDLLEVEGFQFQGKCFVPSFELVAEGAAVATIGYPGYPSDSWMKSFQISFGSIRTNFQFLDQKAVAPGNVVNTNGRILSHTCSTLPGVSGGPVVLLKDPGAFEFCGIEIEGWPDSNYNIAIATTHPSFQKAYYTFVQKK